VSKLIALSADPAHTWFATGGLFDWAADFLLARVSDPRLREELRRDAASGYLYLDTVPEDERVPLLRALREELPAAVDRDLYPRPLDLREQQPLMAARVKSLAALAWSYDEAAARRGTPLTLRLSSTVHTTVSHGLQPWLTALLRERLGLPLPPEPETLDLSSLPDPGRRAALTVLRDDVPAAAPEALSALDRDAARWSHADLRALTLQAEAALDG
jgi:hypothetical protein